MVIFVFRFKMCGNSYFIVFFEHQPKLPKKAPKKAKTFHILQNTGYLKKNVCCNPAVDQRLVFLNLCFLENIDVEQKQNLKSEQKQR